MSKRLHRSSSSSSSDLVSDDPNDIDAYFTPNRLPCRTLHSGRYQSDMYTGLLASNRTYSNGKSLTRLEQLITLFHDDQIRALLLTIRHHAMKQQWSSLLIYLKSLLQSSYCRAYIRLFWQLTFRCLLSLNNEKNTYIDINLLPQTFDDLFHSPTIDRTQAFYSYLCLHLIMINKNTEQNQIDLYHDIETRYKNSNLPYASGRCKHVTYLPRFDRRFEQLLLVQLQFLIHYRQWTLNMNQDLSPSSNNPFFQSPIINIEDEREIELWTFKLSTDFHEIELISNHYFDIFDSYLLKYLHFLYSTETNIEQIERLLEEYIQNHSNYINAYKYIYWYNSNIEHLKRLVELDPSSTPYVLIYCRQIASIECIDRLFDYLDYDKNRHDSDAWQLLCDTLLTIDPDDEKSIQCIRDNWTIRKRIWSKFHFVSLKRMNSFQATIAYIVLDDEDRRMKIREKWFFNKNVDQIDNLHRRLTAT